VTTGDQTEGQLLPRIPEDPGPAFAPFVIVGVLCVLSQWWLLRLVRGLNHDNASELFAVLPLILGLAIPAALLLVWAARVVPATPNTRWSLACVVLVGLAMRVVWFGQPAPLEDDFMRYLWDGGVLAHGLNPYRLSPLDLSQTTSIPHGYEALVAAGRSVLEKINFPDLRTMYPSVAQAAFAIAHGIAPFKLDGLRIVFLIAEFATCALMMALLRDLKVSPLWVVLYWWNPLPVYMLSGIVHVDALVPPLVLAALWFANRERVVCALLCAAAGAGVKVWPVLIMPLLARAAWPDVRRAPDWGRLVIYAGVSVLALGVTVGPAVWSARGPSSGLAAYTAGWSTHNAFYAWSYSSLSTVLEPETTHRILRMGLALATGGIAIWVAFTGPQTRVQRVRGTLIIAASVFYLSPTQFPWYAIWFLPLAAILRCWPLLLASVTLPAYYLFFPLWVDGIGNAFFYRVSFIHSTPVLGWLLWSHMSERRQGQALKMQPTS
jgi:alpha-1,6-mannosyltransferase